MTSFRDAAGTVDSIPSLAREVFADFRLGSSVTLAGYKMPETSDDSDGDPPFRHVSQYVCSAEFTSDSTFATTDRDAEVYAVFSVLLSWSRDRLYRFAGFASVPVDRLVLDLIELDRRGLLRTYKNRPVCLQTFRVLQDHRRTDLRAATDVCTGSGFHCADAFDIDRYVDSRLKAHFQRVALKLRTESWNKLDLRSLVDTNSVFGTPFEPITGRSGQTAVVDAMRPKYITGVACTGKTTVLSRLELAGWTVRSRGQLGTFAGKSKTPAHVASLHGALDFAYRTYAGRLIGDRGPIDNPLWSVIMQLCDPRYERTMLRELYEFFGKTFNELVVRYHAGFDVVVFLDPFPTRNRARMLKRAENGDCLRGRIERYVDAQFMAYYVYAVLFGYKTVLVPYDDRGNLDTAEFGRVADELCRYFGDPVTGDAATEPWTDPSILDGEVPKILRNYDYSKSLGIFK